jgi:hypothetical protein
MDFAYDLTQALPITKRYQIAETFGNAGVPALIDVAGEGGINLSTTTSMADMVGLAIDTAVYTTTQGTGADSAERLVGVIVNPNAVWRALMSGGAAENTVLVTHDITTANSGGTTLTTGDNHDSPRMDEGICWFTSGANQSQRRKITGTSSTAVTVLVPFDLATVVGDTFIDAPYWRNATTTVQLTTLLTQADASIAVATGAGAKVIEMELKEAGNSFIHLCPTDHVYTNRPT